MCMRLKTTLSGHQGSMDMKDLKAFLGRPCAVLTVTATYVHIPSIFSSLVVGAYEDTRNPDISL